MQNGFHLESVVHLSIFTEYKFTKGKVEKKIFSFAVDIFRYVCKCNIVLWVTLWVNREKFYISEYKTHSINF